MTKKHRKVDKRPLWKIIVLCALSALLGGIAGYLWGWRAGVAFAPPIIFSMPEHQSDKGTIS